MAGGVIAEDFDNDGDLDLMVSEWGLSDQLRYYENNGDGTFADVTKAAGLDKVLHTMGCNFGDLDNDVWRDFYLGTGDPSVAMIIPNRMFRNDGGRRFQDVTTAGGFGHLQKGHGVAFADFDHDGDQDLYESLGGANSGDVYRNAFFENPGTTNHWIAFQLEGVQSNRPAVGARLKLTVATAEGRRTIHKTVNSGGSFGANPLRQHIGLGAARQADVEICWPATGKTQAFARLAPGFLYQIREGDSKPVRVKLKKVKLGEPTEFSGTKTDGGGS